MKELIVNNDGQGLFSEDLQTIQLDALQAAEGLLANLPDGIISGCEITGAGPYNVAAGFVLIAGRVRRFAGATGVALPGSIAATSTAGTTRPLASGGTANIFTDHSCEFRANATGEISLPAGKVQSLATLLADELGLQFLPFRADGVPPAGFSFADGQAGRHFIPNIPRAYINQNGTQLLQNATLLDVDANGKPDQWPEVLATGWSGLIEWQSIVFAGAANNRVAYIDLATGGNAQVHNWLSQGISGLVPNTSYKIRAVFQQGVLGSGYQYGQVQFRFGADENNTQIIETLDSGVSGAQEFIFYNENLSTGGIYISVSEDDSIDHEVWLDSVEIFPLPQVAYIQKN